MNFYQADIRDPAQMIDHWAQSSIDFAGLYEFDLPIVASLAMDRFSNARNATRGDQCSNSDYSLVRNVEEWTFCEQTGLNAAVFVLTRLKQENARLGEENERQQKQIVELESQPPDFVSLRVEMKQLCKNHRKDTKKVIRKNYECYRRFRHFGQKIQNQWLDEQRYLISIRLKNE